MRENCSSPSSFTGSRIGLLGRQSAFACAIFLAGQRELPAADNPHSCESLRKQLQASDRPERHRLLGDCEEASGNFREAANQYQIAARAAPTEENLFSFGSELLKYHGYSEALQVFSYSVERFPKSARIRIAFGVVQYSLGQYKEAVGSLCQAVDLNPADTRALGFLGKMIRVAPELSKEIELRLEHFARIYPQNPAANFYYALSLRSSNAAKQAEHYMERAVAADPAYAEAHYELGQLYADQGRTKAAILEYQKAIQYRPKLSAAHYRLAQLYSKEGETERAHREFKIVETLRAH